MDFAATWTALKSALSGDYGEIDPAEVARVVREQRLDDPQQLAALLIEAARRDATHRSARQPLEPIALRSKQRPISNEAIHHRPPSEPLLINGVETDPALLAAYEGTPLHYVLVPYSDTERRLVAFDQPLPLEEMQLEVGRRVAAASVIDPQAVQRAAATTAARRADLPTQRDSVLLSALGLPEPSFAQELSSRPFVPIPPMGGGCGYMGAYPCTTPTPLPPAGAQFFDDANYSGNWFWLDPGYEIRDLRRLRRGRSIFGDDGDWNDVISSIRSGAWNSYLQLFEHIDCDGSSLTLHMHDNVANLTSLGWNDRVSSVRHIQVVSIPT